MPTLKDIELKIAAVKKTKQITKAMNMVATSKLRGAQANMEAFRPYAAKFAEVLGSLAEKAGEEASPLLTPRETVKKVLLVLCTSDRGLCGGFNINLINMAEKFIKERSDDNIEVAFTNFGKKGRDYCKKSKMEILDDYLGVVGGQFSFSIASEAGAKIIDQFVTEEVDEVHLIYSEFINMGRQIPRIKQILPIPPIEKVEEEEVEDKDQVYLPEHICEPSPAELLGDMLPRNVYVQIYNGLLETSTSEHAARMTAMDNASKACTDIIDNLTLIYNKARQAAITADLMDIVGGAEALKG
jgi:F-type H+-transporting ATPase subunit gamma